MGRQSGPSLLAISDLHVTYPENRRIVENLRGGSPRDWLIVCGDVSELSADLEWALGVLRERFATVVWVPGNHDLWSTPGDPLGLRGEARYRHLVAVCRQLSVLTPEDPYPQWNGPGGPLTVAPLFVLYDYSFGRNVAPTKEQALARADTRRGSSAATSWCCTPTRTPPGRRGARRGCA